MIEAKPPICIDLLKGYVDNFESFEFGSSQTLGTVIFDRSEDSSECQITIIKKGKIIKFTSNEYNGVNHYNPSRRRTASCVYLKEECSNLFVKICTIQHKGNTFVELRTVSQCEILDLFVNDTYENYKITLTK
jgi:hypothetical protein